MLHIILPVLSIFHTSLALHFFHLHEHFIYSYIYYIVNHCLSLSSLILYLLFYIIGISNDFFQVCIGICFFNIHIPYFHFFLGFLFTIIVRDFFSLKLSLCFFQNSSRQHNIHNISFIFC